MITAVSATESFTWKVTMEHANEQLLSVVTPFYNEDEVLEIDVGYWDAASKNSKQLE